MIVGKQKSSFILLFMEIFSPTSINIFLNLFIRSTTATNGVILDEPINTLMKNGLRQIEYCVINSDLNSNIYIPIIYKAVLEEDNKSKDVYVYTIPKIYTKARIEFEVGPCNNCIDSMKISLKYKNNYFFNLKPINHKNIKPILHTYESDNFFYCIQEMPTNSEKCRTMVELPNLTLWQAKKLILSYFYGLKILNDNNITMGNYDTMMVTIDKNNNIIFNQMIGILRYYNYSGNKFNKISYHENKCLDLYDFSGSPEHTFGKLKIYLIGYDILYLKRFCVKFLLKVNPTFKNRQEINDLCQIFKSNETLSDVTELKPLNWINNIINDNNFACNIVSVPDFRKFTDNVGETPNYTFMKEKNKMTVYSREDNNSKLEYEFKYIENAHPIQLSNGNLHYRDMEIRKNKELIDLDDLCQEDFLELKKEMESLVLEVEMYNCKNSKLKISNEILDIFLFEDPKKHYSFVYKLKLDEQIHFIFIKVVDGEVKLKGLDSPCPEHKFNEFSNKIKEFIQNIDLIFDDKEYMESICLGTESHQKFKNNLYRLDFFFMPGLGTRMQIKEDKIYQIESSSLQLKRGEIIYELSRSDVRILCRNNEFFEIEVSDEIIINLTKLTKGEARREMFMGEIDYLDKGSLIRIN